MGRLVLTRKPDEAVILRTPMLGDFRVTVCTKGIRKNSVRLLIDAPDDVEFLRSAADGSIQTGNGTSRQVVECNL